MLKVEYPCRDILSSYPNHIKPTITWAEAKKHLQDVRLRRQNQLATNLEECNKIRNIHKQIFNRQFDSNSTEKSSDDKPIKSINNEHPLSTKKYLIPRMEYAPILYRQSIPSFEVEKSIILENDIPIVKELTEYLTESSRAILNNKIENNKPSPSIKKKVQRRSLTVSSVSSADKRANKVYEKWPDYNEISEIVGYRIDPPPSKTVTSNSVSSRPSDTTIQRKKNKSGFSTTSKQIKSVVNLSSSATRRQSSKNKKSTKTDITPIIIMDKPSPTIPKIPLDDPTKEIKSKLPNILCPSSKIYSNRIQTRQWLIKNHFSSNAIRTLPLL